MAGHCWTTDVAACESLSDFLSVMTLDQTLTPDRTWEALDASETHGNKREAHLAMSADLSFVQQISICTGTLTTKYMKTCQCISTYLLQLSPALNFE